MTVSVLDMGDQGGLLKQRKVYQASQNGSGIIQFGISPLTEEKQDGMCVGWQVCRDPLCSVTQRYWPP